MRQLHKILIICLLYSFNLFSQVKPPQYFKLEGKINTDTGIVILEQVASAEFYPEIKNKMTSRINNGHFFFQGIIVNPLAFRISCNNTYLSDMFIVESGTQKIVVDITAAEKTPVVTNATMQKHKEYLLAFSGLRAKNKLFDKKYDSLITLYKGALPENIKLEIENDIKKSYKENDEVLLKYVKDHPDSFFAFWRLAQLLSFGYESVFDSIFSAFNKKIRATQSGKLLSINIAKGKILGVGAKFPAVPVVDVENRKIISNFPTQQYTLIDFWYSSCVPCVAQFEDLKKVYRKYKNKGFEIIGISTDKAKYKQDWLNGIKTYGLLWPQYWDIDGQEAVKLSVIAFPTNFLVDNNGVIVQKNLKPAQLDEFLSRNIVIK